MSERSEELGQGFIAELYTFRELLEQRRSEMDEDEYDRYVHGDGEILNTGDDTVYSMPQTYGVSVEKRVIVTLAGVGPALRVVADFKEGEREPYSLSLQHLDWMQPWMEVKMDDDYEKALKWFLDSQGFLDYEGGER